MNINLKKTTVAVGPVENQFLKDFPESVMAEYGHSYTVSVRSSYFIGVFQIDEGAQTAVRLPLDADSHDFAVDWGDGCLDEYHSLNYRQDFSQTAQLRPGDFKIEEQGGISYFDGMEIKKVDIPIDQLMSGSRRSAECHVSKSAGSRSAQLLLGIREYIKIRLCGHKYQKAGSYTITVKGGLAGFRFGQTPSPDGQGLSEILSWGDGCDWTTLQGAFAGCGRLKKIPAQPLPNVNDCSSAFLGCVRLETIPDLPEWLPVSLIWGSAMLSGDAGIQTTAHLKKPDYLAEFQDMFAGCADSPGWYEAALQSDASNNH